MMNKSRARALWVMAALNSSLMSPIPQPSPFRKALSGGARRCDCGRAISANKSACLACSQKLDVLVEQGAAS